MKKNKYKNLLFKYSMFLIISFTIITSITSCDKLTELEESMAYRIREERGIQNTMSSLDIIESMRLESFTIKAGNEDYIILEELTEEEKVEETSAEHPYQIYNFPNPKNINIGTDKFLTQINTIRKNIDKYTDAMVTLEGMYGTYISHDTSLKEPMIYRNGPGCCGNDDYDGFLLINIDNVYKDEEPLRLNDWIKVTGAPFMYEHTNNLGQKENYLFLLVASIQKFDLKSRGPEMVND